MIKVAKFGGSSVANAEQFRKVKAIIEADSSRRFVVSSACGKESNEDHKVTDLLYLCEAHVRFGVSYEPIFEQIEKKYRRIRDELNLKLLTWRERTEGYQFQFDVSAMLRADMATMAEKHQKAIRGGWMKPNEVRERDGLPPDPDGDVLLISRDLQPLRMAMSETNESEGQP